MSAIAAVIALVASVAPSPSPGAASRTLTLDAAIHTALARQPDVRAADAQVQSARARVTAAHAPMEPQLSLTMRYGASAGDDGRFFSARDGQSWTTGLGGSLLLFDFGRTNDRYKEAQLGAEAQQDDRDATARTVVLDVELAYFDALGAEKLIAVADDTLAAEQRHESEIEAFVKAGSRPEIDLAKARSAVATAASAVVKAENDFASARATLAQAMGDVEDGDDFALADADPAAIDGEDGGTAALVATAMTRRPELAALRAEIAAQKLAVHDAKHGLYPQIKLTGDLGTSGVGVQDQPQWSASIGVTLSWTIFDGGAADANARAEAWSGVILDAQQAALQQRVWLELEQARLGVRSAKADQAAAAASATAARELLTLAEKRYQEGVGNVIELADAQLTATTAASAEVRAAYELASARVRLSSALGG